MNRNNKKVSAKEVEALMNFYNVDKPVEETFKSVDQFYVNNPSLDPTKTAYWYDYSLEEARDEYEFLMAKDDGAEINRAYFAGLTKAYKIAFQL